MSSPLKVLRNSLRSKTNLEIKKRRPLQRRRKKRRKKRRQLRAKMKMLPIKRKRPRRSRKLKDLSNTFRASTSNPTGLPGSKTG
jgi:hypothetical protein